MADVVGYSLSVEVSSLGMAGRLVELTPAAIACLRCMALVARDKASQAEPAHVYFAGWEYLARAGLGYDVYDNAAEQAVTRAVRQLVAAGLVKPVGRRHGMRQGMTLYELLL